MWMEFKLSLFYLVIDKNFKTISVETEPSHFLDI